MGDTIMPSIIRATTTNGVQVAPDNSGSLVLQTNGTTTALTIDTSQNATFAGTVSMGSSFLRNRIINGDMRIDQRNAGASVTPTNGQYTLDRWAFYVSQSSKLSTQQNAGSVTPPAGFTNYLGVTSSSAYSVVSGDFFLLSQAIEGFNVADLAWGTANARTVTLSFWVRSSLTGTFGGSIQNQNQSRSYPFTYTISAANTWEQKSITITGDTSGTWLTNNGNGLWLFIGLGNGTTYSGTAGSWSGNNFTGATGATSVVGTNGATFYITGVQLEIGTTATPFERRLYSQELANCYRYYWQDPAVGLDTPYADTTYNTVVKQYFMPANMRAMPTITQTGSIVAKNNIGTVNTFGTDAPTSNTNQTNIIIYATGTARTYLYRPVQFSAEL